jgi:hypothetical protein
MECRHGGWKMRSKRVLLGSVLVAVMVSGLATAAGGRANRPNVPVEVAPRLPSLERELRDSPLLRPSRANAPGLTENFDVLGHARMKSGGIGGDVYFFDHGDEGKFAYVGTWVVPCPGGVKIVDVTDPSHPEWVAEAGGRRGVDFQDMAVATVGGRDILAVGLQECGRRGKGGLGLYDVTEPSKPKFLSFLKTPAAGVHELDIAITSDGRAFALMAVPFAEGDFVLGGQDRGGEFRIADITDPTNPVEVSDWGIIADSDIPRVNSAEPITRPFQGLGDFPVYFDHSARAADNGTSAYVSYWDGGVLKFDINDPANPQLIGRTTFPIDSDGDAHSLTLYDTEGTRYILQNQEDFSPLSPATVTSSATGSQEFAASEEFWMPTILSEVGAISAEAHDAGDGCEGNDFAGAGGKIALVDWADPVGGGQPACGKKRQILNAAEAGVGALMINVVGEDRPFVFPVARKRIRKDAHDLVVVEVSSLDPLASAIRQSAAPETVTLSPNTPSWGTLRIYSEAEATDADGDGVVEYEQVGEFSDLPHVTGTLDEVAGPGAYTIHNTEVNGNRAYSSWYSNGIAAIDLSDPTDPQLVGRWVPPSGKRGARWFGRGPAAVWGVAIDPSTGIVYGSDMRTGLWMLQPTGPAVPD